MTGSKGATAASTGGGTASGSSGGSNSGELSVKVVSVVGLLVILAVAIF